MGRSFIIDDFFAQELAAAAAALGAGGSAHSITVNGKARDLTFKPKDILVRMLFLMDFYVCKRNLSLSKFTICGVLVIAHTSAGASLNKIKRYLLHASQE